MLHIGYTAREDSGALKPQRLITCASTSPQDDPAPGLVLLDLRRDFPSEWSRMQHPTDPAAGNVFELDVQPAFVPDSRRRQNLQESPRLALLARCTDAADYTVACAAAARAAAGERQPDRPDA